MSTEQPDQFGKALCKVFKLDPKKVRSIIIRVNPDDIVLVEVQQMLHKKESKELLTILQNYKLGQIQDDQNENKDKTD